MLEALPDAAEPTELMTLEALDATDCAEEARDEAVLMASEASDAPATHQEFMHQQRKHPERKTA